MGHRYKTIFVSLGITNMYPHTVGINITNLEFNSFTKPQPHAVDGEEEHLVILDCSCGKQLICLLYGDNIRYSGCFWRLD